MIIEYEDKYNDDVKDLLVELQEYIVSIDKEKYNIIGEDYRDKYFSKTIDEISMYNGKIYLYLKNNVVCGMIAGIINNDKVSDYDFCAPKRGRITEFIVSSKYRNSGCGVKLLNAIEEYFRKNECSDILIGVFAYNELARSYYEKNGYHIRMLEMTKVGI